MANHIQVKIHPDVQTVNSVPDVLPNATWIIGHKTNLFIDGKYVFKFKVSMLIRKDGEQDPTYSYSRYMRFGFLPTDNKDELYQTGLWCYQTAVIEFNKSLDIFFGRDRFMDCRFDDPIDVNRMIDNALNLSLN
ncbi:hypothetical protein SNE25_18330 [Mucilaginibacter sabulilitoris]|uniref:Uncharacterized protein n=1 Tax=Mucilaginibacter sabulilitoris TaxID=1173583 RepID=A0ABZ0TDJ7_9SPHI|nr:hypothetical protein [Mucilaginibacter sabulilitoris]WPU91277.1 hypothetical protein SNE25_18330 [Mucilaginibacter sabulilitoris]